MDTVLTNITEYMLKQSCQVAILFALVAIVCLALKKKTAHLRYLLWLLILAKCLVPSIVTISLAILPQEPEPAQIAGVIPLTTETSTPMEYTIVPVVTAQPPEPSIIERLTEIMAQLSAKTYFALGWFAGLIVFSMAVIIKAVKINARFTRARRRVGGNVKTWIDSFFAEFLPHSAPSVYLLEGIGQPFVWGLVKGSIYLPVNFAKTGTRDHRRKILAHELAHITRFDALVNVLQVVAQGIFWFHPLVWLANRNIRAEREKCCDETAIAKLSATPADYSSAIVDTLVAEYKSTLPVPSLAIAGPIKNIEDRIKTIMKPGKKFQKRPTIIAILVILVMAAAIVPTTIALTRRPTKTDIQIKAEKAALQARGEEGQELADIIKSMRPIKYGSGQGVAKVERNWYGEKEKGIIEFKYKDTSSRFDYFEQKSIFGKKELLKKCVSSQNAKIWYGNTVLIEPPERIDISGENIFGENMHPEAFNIFYVLHLKDWLNVILKHWSEGKGLVSVVVDEKRHIRIKLQMINEGTNRSNVAQLMIDTQDGYKLLSVTSLSLNDDGDGSKTELKYNADWHKYGEQWYVKSAKLEKNEINVLDREDKPIPAKKSYRYIKVKIIKYEPDIQINDDEFTLKGMSIKPGTPVRDVRERKYEYRDEKESAVEVEGNVDKYNLMAKGGKGRVEALDPNAANLIRRYLRALEKSDWKTALSMCSISVMDKAQQYPTPESFFNIVVPVKEILNKLCDPYIGYGTRPPKYFAYNFNVGISKADMPRDVSWQWKARKLEGRENWEIDFPAIPFETWLANENQVITQAIKETEQLIKEMAPRLKGVRTLLTAKRKEFEVGDPIYFRLQLINQGNSILTYDCQQVAVNNSMTIEGPDGKEVKYTAESFQTNGGPVLLKPGETKALFDQFDITEQYDIRQPGQYRVQFNGNGLRIGVGKEDTSDLNYPISLQYYPGILPSNTLTITIHSGIKQEMLDVGKDGVEGEKAVSQTNTDVKPPVEVEGEKTDQVNKTTDKQEKARVSIESRFLLVDENFLEDVGFQFKNLDSDELPKATVYTGTPTEGETTEEALKMDEIDDFQKNFLIRATQAHKHSKVLTAPRITVIDGEECEISVTKERYYVTSFTEPNDPSQPPEQNTDTCHSGIQLIVLPRVTNDNKNVLLDLDIEMRNLLGWDEYMYKDKYPYKLPIIEKVTIDTKASVADKGTILIGGLKVTPVDFGQPAGDVAKNEAKDKQVLLILVKPTIYEPADGG